MAQGATAGLDLRAVFGAELQSRLPHLVAARDGRCEDLNQARRDAHTLGTSAFLVGEPEIARLARAVEADLATGPLPELVGLLQAWTP